ncbi:2'-5' RNA ligase [Streptacidiphilus sp. EB129]
MTDPQSMADHWWWRPGWSPGRRFLTWHLTFDGQDQVHRLAADWRGYLGRLPDLDLIPDRWLHLTMQGLGFVDEVKPEELDAIVEIARARLSLVPAFEVTIDRPAVTPEAIRWEAEPGEPVAAVRDAIRTAIGEVWAEVPEARDGFGPHVSIAYSCGAGPIGPVVEAVNAAPSAPTAARIASAELILMGRDNRMYEWETVASVPLG